MPRQYKMSISRMTVDKLGVKLYDKVSAVIAELIANSYDADATEVKVIAPMDEYLATKIDGVVSDKGYTIIIEDNGIGMHPDNVNGFYLTVGAERRLDPARGNASPKFSRKVMGRKGIGKLAPFGICGKIEVISSGVRDYKDQNQEQDYEIAHLILEREEILQQTVDSYLPLQGSLDGQRRKDTGTKIILKDFDRRKVPSMDQFERQLSHRFGISTLDWKITLIDSTKTPSDPCYSREVGMFSVPTMDNTMIKFEGPSDEASSGDPNSYQAIGPGGETMTGLLAGFKDDDGAFYGVTGWIAYSREPYKDDLMAGVRIYCRGKIAAQTSIFDHKAGFTGEHSVRSYLVGELHADWLDVSEDLISTDRRDILWSHDIGQKFQAWGQHVIREIGKLSRDPLKKRVWDVFKEVGKVDERVEKTFPREEHKEIRENAYEIIERIGSRIRQDELNEQETVDNYVELGMMLAPHVTLDRKLKEATNVSVTPLNFISALLKTARVAELSSYGRVAEDRIKVIKKLFELTQDQNTEEAHFQNLIKEAPWLINPQWSPLAANQAFSTVKQAFEKYYKDQTGREITLNDFSNPSKRPDFVLANEGSSLELVEIKKLGHALLNNEVDRIINYVKIMREFLDDPAQTEFRKYFNDKFHVTLVCESINLSGAQQVAFDSFISEGILNWLNWNSFLLKTKTAHEDFLSEADKQREYGFN